MSFNPLNFFPEDFLPENFLPEAAIPAAFIGPVIEDLSLVINVAIFPRDFSSRFNGSGLAFSLFAGALPAGLALSAAGVLSGTPTGLEIQGGLVIRGTDGVDTGDSNAFSISVVATLPGVQRAGFVVNAGRMMAR